MAETFQFELVSPERLLLSEEVEQVVVPGSEGDFTMLPRHAPLLTALRPGLLDIGTGAGRRRFFVRGGFAEISPAGLTVLASTAIDLEDLDRAALDQAIRDAEEDVADARDDAERDSRRMQLDQLRQVQATLSV
jgi:F-type H+-transporting ATPase subunit epsilon